MALIPVMSTIILRIPLPVVVHDEQPCMQQSMQYVNYSRRAANRRSRS